MSDQNRIDPAGPPAATDPSEETDAATTESAESAEITALKRERDDYYDRLLRKTAEFDNYRKRVERERREQADQAVVNIFQELLLVADDFDRALAVGEHESESVAAYRTGVELIQTKLHELLKRYNVTPIEALGSDFDPNFHQAVTYEASPSHRDGEVIEELRRGYKIGDRLLRPAMVKVAKA